MVTVAAAEKIIREQVYDFGTVSIPLMEASGRTLAEDIIADRAIPAGDRATMDGIAILFSSFEKGNKKFKIAATQGAGEKPLELIDENDCIEIMTGAMLSASVDTVVPYEDIEIAEGFANIRIETLKQKQNIHQKGTDRKSGEIIVKANKIITPDIINAAAFAGYQNILVKKLPKIIVLSSGDELVDIHETPPAYKIRRSNSYTLKAALANLNIVADIDHLPDDKTIITQRIKDYLNNYDVVMLTGGVSKGKYDYISDVLEELFVTKLFHRIKQKPGKPFWFGVYKTARIFAFPGNPVSTFLCFHRYFVPWLNACLGINEKSLFAVLVEDVVYKPELQYFLQVKLTCNENAQLVAMPITGNGSGDLVNLTLANAFMELPADQTQFNQGDIFRIWQFKTL